MLIIIELIFCFLLCIKVTRWSSVFGFLVLINIFSFFSQFLVGYFFHLDLFPDIITVFNFIFICINSYLVLTPWRYSLTSTIVLIDNSRKSRRVESLLTIICILNWIINIAIAFLVRKYVPNIADFKAGEFKQLYDQIPMFSTFFRTAAIIQDFGILMFPYILNNLCKEQYKKAFKLFLLSCSSLMAGVAFYSRAQILSFFFISITSFFFIKPRINLIVSQLIFKWMKRIVIIAGVGFVMMTISRFSEMDYYADRIPKESVIQNQFFYNMIDYASQGNWYGITTLDNYSPSKNLHGGQTFRLLYQILGYLNIIDWKAETEDLVINEVYGDAAGAFFGYTTPMVYNFGYFLTFIISLIYNRYVSKTLKSGSFLSIQKYSFLILLLYVAVVSIFYPYWGALPLSILFILFTYLL